MKLYINYPWSSSLLRAVTSLRIVNLFEIIFNIKCFFQEFVYALLRSLKNGMKYINKTYNETYNESYITMKRWPQHFMTICRNFKNQSWRFRTLRILKTNRSVLWLYSGNFKKPITAFYDYIYKFYQSGRN